MWWVEMGVWDGGAENKMRSKAGAARGTKGKAKALPPPRPRERLAPASAA
jgi:hypothetical protein